MTPFWISHAILWIAYLVERAVNKCIVTKICEYIEVACIGAMFMYLVITY